MSDGDGKDPVSAAAVDRDLRAGRRSVDRDPLVDLQASLPELNHGSAGNRLGEGDRLAFARIGDRFAQRNETVGFVANVHIGGDDGRGRFGFPAARSETDDADRQTGEQKRTDELGHRAIPLCNDHVCESPRRNYSDEGSPRTSSAGGSAPSVPGSVISASTEYANPSVSEMPDADFGAPVPSRFCPVTVR